MPHKIVISDPIAFARSQSEMRQTLPFSAFPRIVDEVVLPAEGVLNFRLGAQQTGAGYNIFHLQVETTLSLRCQRCLQAMVLPVAIDSRLRTVPVGSEIADEEFQDDVFDLIEVASELDVIALIEDEVLLALPQAPRHPTCESPFPHGNEVNNPFSVLAALKK